MFTDTLLEGEEPTVSKGGGQEARSHVHHYDHMARLACKQGAAQNAAAPALCVVRKICFSFALIRRVFVLGPFKHFKALSTLAGR